MDLCGKDIKTITVVMPCLNESKALDKTIDEIPLDSLKGMGYKTEVLVVDGGSSDGSVSIARDRGAKVLISERGYGKQYRLGFEHAGGDIIVTADSDGSYPLSDIARIVKILNEGGFDFISVNRFADMYPGSMGITRRTGNFMLTLLTNLLFGLCLKDSQSGMWVFRKDILAKMALTSNGMSLSEEIKIKAFRKFKSLEVPGFYRPRIGKEKLRPFRDGWRNLSFLIKEWRKSCGDKSSIDSI
jgi:glycosyltransferase involved in cell wall biosynthesis